MTAKPAGVSWEVAGALYVAGTTAYAAVRAVDLAQGDVVAVAGAAGGVGSIAVQLAVDAGATCLGIAGPSNDEWLRAHGVIPVNYGDDLAERLRAAAPEGRVDAFLDFFGGGYVELAVGELGIAPDRVDTIIDFAAAEQFKVQTAGNADAANAEVLAELAALIADGRLEVPIAEVFRARRRPGGVPHARTAAYQGQAGAPPVTAAARGWKFLFVREPAGGLEDDAASHLDGVVGEPLVEPAQQRHVDGGGDAVLPFLVHQHGEEVTVQIVHRIVFLADARRLLRVLRQQHLLGAVAQFDCHPAHFGEVAVDLFGQRMLRMTAAGDLGDVQREGSHPVDVGDDLDRADDRPQVACHRRLQSKQHERRLLGLGAHRGDLLVVGDHLLGQHQVGL